MTHRFIAAACLATAILLPLTAPAQAAAPADTFGGAVVAVREHRSDEHIGKLSVSRLDGATLFVAAEPGLTAEWLQRSFRARLSAALSTSAGSLRASAIQVSVRSGGNGFWVTLRADSQRDAPAVLALAQSLLEQQS